MTKRMLLVAVCLFGLCRWLPAQAIPGHFPSESGPFSDPFLRLPTVTLGDQNRFSFATAFNWHTPVNYLPTFNPDAPKRVAPSTAKDDNLVSLESVPEIRTTSPIYVGGEIGFTYGRSTGKYGYEYEQGYILGEIGNEWFRLTVGASHERLSGNGWRYSR
jgi:hypothetical protein